MNRPYIICHMVTSIDGKVTGEFLNEKASIKTIEKYYEINRNYKADGFACGRETMEGSFTNYHKVDVSMFKEDVEYTDFIAKNDFKYYAVSFDRFGKVGWISDHISDEDEGYNNAHIIEVLTTKTPKKYLSYLKSINVSYIFASSINEAMIKLKNYFNINLLLLEGGSIINQAFLDEGLVDELSLLVAPLVASSDDKQLFYKSDKTHFELKDCRLYDGVLHLLYKKGEEK